MNINNEPRIYVACLAGYNNGIMHGKWIDANQEASDLENEISEIMANSPIDNAEEWAIHDYECFGGIQISEWETMETISKLASEIEEHGELFAQVYDYTNNIQDAKEMIQDRLIGLYDSMMDYAEETTDLSEVPEYLHWYINFNAIARDMENNLTVFEVDRQLGIFH